MKYTFQLISDVHLEMGTYHSLKPKAPYLLLAGDIGYPETQIYKDFMRQCSKKFEKVFYTAGNHEYYQGKNHKNMKEIDDIIEDTCSKYDNIYYLQNSYYDFDDLRIVGSTLWSDVKDSDDLTNDYHNIYKNNRLITQDNIRQIHKDNVEYLETIIQDSSKPLLIMTHHLSSYEMIPECYQSSAYKSHFASDLEYLFKQPVVTWICGHSHGFNKKLINNIPCIINAIGYPSEPRRGSSLNYIFDIDI